MAVTPFAVRGITPDDAGAVLDLARALPEWFNRQGLEQMERDLATHHGSVATTEGRLLGFATWHAMDDRVANLSWMGVARAEQHRGVGTALLAAIVRDARDRGLRVLEVSTVADTVDYAPYAETRRFYRARGFLDFRIDSKFYGEGEDRYDRLRLRLDLDCHEVSSTGRPTSRPRTR